MLIFSAAAILLAVNLMGKNTPLCRNENFRVNGSVCWVINMSSRHTLEGTGANGRHRKIDLNVPRFSVDKSYLSQQKIPLQINIFSKVHKINYVSHVNLSLSFLDSDDGAKIGAQWFEDAKSYKLISAENIFNIYQNHPVDYSFRYFVPIKQPMRQLYLTCNGNCQLHSIYRNIAYSTFIPFEWKNEYMEIQRLSEQLIDSFL